MIKENKGKVLWDDRSDWFIECPEIEAVGNQINIMLWSCFPKIDFIHKLISRGQISCICSWIHHSMPRDTQDPTLLIGECLTHSLCLLPKDQVSLFYSHQPHTPNFFFLFLFTLINLFYILGFLLLIAFKYNAMVNKI